MVCPINRRVKGEAYDKEWDGIAESISSIQVNNYFERARELEDMCRPRA